jgi:hypothetical protein
MDGRMDGSGAEQSPAKTIPGTAGVWPRAAVTSIGARPNQRSEGAREPGRVLVVKEVQQKRAGRR